MTKAVEKVKEVIGDNIYKDLISKAQLKRREI